MRKVLNTSNKSGKILLITTLVVIFSVVGFFAARYFIYTKIERAIVKELDQLATQGIAVAFDHIDVDPWTAKIEFFQLSVTVRKPGQPTGLNATIPYVLIKGVEIIPFLRHRILVLHEITAQQAAITYDKGALAITEKKNKRKIELEEIHVGSVNLPGIDLYINNNPGDTLAHILSDVKMRDLELKKQLDSLIWKQGNIEVNDVAVRMFESNYGVSAKRASVNITDRSIELDSFRIQPTLSKAAYMEAMQKQATYMAVDVPRLRLENVNWFTYPEATLEVSTAKIQFHINMYRDKRYPFLQRDKRELPAHFLQKLPVKIAIDSVRITESFARYEEYPEEGDSTGTVFFEEIRAVILDVHNDEKMHQQTRMFANAKFMGAGELNANFTFPYDTLLPYRVSGTLEDFELNSLNNILGSTAKVSVESGTMRKLKFDFTYNDIEANGKLSLAYEDLKVLTHKNKNEEQVVSHLKTLLINTIFIKKDVFNNITSDERIGSIHFTRDQRRSVFNFWWKSIFSGVKSAFYIDKVTGNPKKAKKKNSKVKDVLSKIF
jgi:hypothetical protein